MDPDRKRGLAFLLSMSAVPVLGCPAPDHETIDSSSSSSTHGSDSHGTTTDSSASSGGSAEASGSTRTEDSSGGLESGSSESGVGPIDPTCAAYAAHYVECLPMYARYEADYAEYCQYELGRAHDISPECGAAFEEEMACLALADCADILAFTACPEEDVAHAEACPDTDDGGGIPP